MHAPVAISDACAGATEKAAVVRQASANARPSEKLGGRLRKVKRGEYENTRASMHLLAAEPSRVRDLWLCVPTSRQVCLFQSWISAGAA